MVIQEYFKKKFSTMGREYNSDLEIDAISRILGKSKEEVTSNEIELLSAIYMSVTMTENGNNFTDERFKRNLNNMNYYLSQGLTLEEAIEKRDINPEDKEVVVEAKPDSFFEKPAEHKFEGLYSPSQKIQEYFQKKMAQFQNMSGEFNSDLERDAVSKILGKSKEEVTREEIELLSAVFAANTMTENGNNFTDERFRKNVDNMNYYLAQGLSLEEAIEKREETPAEDKGEAFRQKYPALFDEDGKLRDSSYELLDTLMEQYAPQLGNGEEKQPVAYNR